MIAILYNIRSIHNTGSIFRTADAAGVEKMYLCGVTPTPLDRLGKKRNDFIKVSLGAEDSVSWEKVPDIYKLIRRLKKDGVTIIALEQNEKSIPYSKKLDVERNIALIVGNEVEGLPEEILREADHIIEIPMSGKKESLNVSVAFGIAAYEIKKEQK